MFLSVINIMSINCLLIVITTDYGMSYALNEDNHKKLRRNIAEYYRNNWSSPLNVRHKKIEDDGEWVNDPHIIF